MVQQRRRILILDPSQSRAEALKVQLAKFGYTVRWASPAAGQVAELASAHAETFLCDEAVLGYPNFSLCRALHAGGPSRLIIGMISPDTLHPQYEIQGYRHGVDVFLHKPVSPRMLITRLETLHSRLARVHSFVEQQVPPGSNPGSALRGDLELITVADLFQFLCQSRLSGTVTFHRDGQQGMAVLQNGELIYCRLDALEGERAFRALAAWSDGYFVFRRSAGNSCGRNIEKPVMQLILDAVVASETEQGPAQAGMPSL